MRAAVVGVAMLLAATASGGIEHTILHGVSVGRVHAWVGPDTVPGLTTDRLTTIAESSLKEAGIALNPAGGADLFVGATVVLGTSGTCFAKVDAKLLEQARLERNGLSVEAASWSTGGTLLVVETLPGDSAVPVEKCVVQTVEAARRALADFVEHYRAMNPERGSM